MSVKNFLFGAIFLLSIILNFYHLDKIPPGLYIDEASIGVNAYSILKTGKDEYGVKFPLYFKSLGDYKLPVYIYLTSLSMAIFGKNEIAVRFPSAFFGTMAILVLYLLLEFILVKDPTTKLTFKQKYPLLFIFLLSVSPWFMQFVGPAFEVTVAFFFFYLSCYLYLLSQKRKNIFLYIISHLSFIITVYTYHSYKIFTPIVLTLILFNSVKIIKNVKNNYHYIFLTLVSLVLVSYSFFPNFANTRFLQTSAFPIVSVNNAIIFLRNYISYFSTDFLFSFGDGISRHQFLNFGVLARWTLPFLLIGFLAILKKNKSCLKYAALGLLAVGPIPASLVLPSPHSLRSLTIVVAYILIISYGIIYVFDKLRKYTKIMALTITIIFVYEFSIYLHFNFFHYANTTPIDWGGNYKEVVQNASSLSGKYPIILIDEGLQYASEYFHFYNDSLKPNIVKPGLNVEEQFGTKPKLLITGDLTGSTPPSGKLIRNVYLPNVNKNIFAQFWEL